MNDNRMLSAAVLLLAAVLSGGAAAQTLVQHQTMTHEDAALADEAQTASRICGAPIKASFDWKSFLAADTVPDLNNDSTRVTPSSMCSVPLKTLDSMCQDAQGKQAIAAKIKSFQCVYQAGPTQALSLDPAGKLGLASSYEAYQNSRDPTGFVRDWLGKAL